MIIDRLTHVVTALLLSTSGAPLMAQPNSAPGIAWAPYTLTLRSGVEVPGQIGTLEVPQLRRQPAVGTTLIRFVRLPSTAAKPGTPIIYLAGGPGSSAIEAAQGARSVLFDRLRRHGDVILLEQRGIGISSEAKPCSQPWRFPTDRPGDEAAVNRSLEQALHNCAAEWRAAGVTLEAYNSVDNAADVATLIRGLGSGRARLVGISYGTFLGFAVLRDHGALIERAVFAGTEGPDHTVKLPLQADAALRGLSQRFARTGQASGADDLESIVRRVFGRLSREPARVTNATDDAHTISLYQAQVVTAFLMATSENAARLPDLFAAMDKSDFSGLAGMIERLSKFYGALKPMPYAMDAASAVSERRRQLAERQVKSSLFGNAVNFPSADLRGALGVPVLSKRYRSPVRSTVPTLFISGSLDSRTPAGNAEEVRRGFAASTHLVIEGGGHDNDLFLGAPEILDRIESFLGGATLTDERVEARLPK